MMKGFAFWLLIALAAMPALWAVPVTRTFTSNYGSGSYLVTTDIDANPTLSIPGTVYCVNAQFTPTVAISSDWYSSVYDSGLGSNANIGACLIASTAVNQNQPINWLQAGKFDAVNSQSFFNTVGDFNTFMAGQSINPQVSSEKSKYLKPDGTPFTVSGNQFFKADIGLYAKGTASIVSSNPAYNRGPVEYTGSNPSFSPIQLTSTGTVTFQPKLDMSGAAVSGRTYLASCQENVLMYRNGNAGASFLGAVTTITVENPFSCQIGSGSGTYSPQNPAPGSQITFSFNVQNNGNKDISVTSIALESGSQFSNLQITSPAIPFTVTANGGTRQVGGTVSVPNSQGAFPLRLAVNSQTTTADCTGNIRVCSAPQLFVVNVQVGPGGGITCNAVSLSPNTFPSTGGDGALSATCLQNGQPVACPSAGWSWSHTLTPAANAIFLPSQTSPPPLTFRVLSGINAPQSGTVTATLNGVPCTTPASVSITPGGNQPDYIISKITVPFPYVNEQFTSQVTTKNQGPAAATSASVTRVTFPNNPDVRQTINRGLNQNEEVTGPAPFACPATPGTYEEYAKADNDAAITESNENNNELRQNVFCSPIPNACRLQFLNHPSPDFGPGENAEVQAVCTFNGETATCPALSWNEDADEASLNASSTPRSLDPRTRLTVNPVVQREQLGRNVRASSSEPAVPLTCTPVPFNVRTTGGGIGLRITACDVDKPSYLPGQSGFARAHCADSSGSPADCPELAWSAPNSPNYINLAPPLITPPAPTPVRKDFTIAANAQPGVQLIDIRCNRPGDCDPNFAQCPAPLQVAIGQAIFPDIMVSLIPTSLYFEVGQTAIVEVTTKNVGAAAGASTTRAKDTSLYACPPDEYRVTGYPQKDEYSCLCTDQNIGLHTITANADDNREIAESNENNNAASNIFYCCPPGGCFQHACFDFF